MVDANQVFTVAEALRRGKVYEQLGCYWFEEPLLLATVVFGAIYFVRSFGRADEPHLDSAIPPVCLLLAYAAYLAWRRWWQGWRGVQTAIVVVGFASWVALLGVDMMFKHPFSVLPPDHNPLITWSQQKRVNKILEWSKPGERILDLHLWQLGPDHHAAIVIIAADHPLPAQAYRARLAGLPGLSHLTIEVRGA